MAHKAIYFHGLSLDKLNDKSKYNENIAYGRSKTCNILFTRELSDRLEKKGVKVCKNEDSALVWLSICWLKWSPSVAVC